MTTETYTPRRGAPTSGRFQPRVGTRGIDPTQALADDLLALADRLDARSERAGGRDRSLLGREFDDMATEIRRIVKEHH